MGLSSLEKNIVFPISKLLLNPINERLTISSCEWEHFDREFKIGDGGEIEDKQVLIQPIHRGPILLSVTSQGESPTHIIKYLLKIKLKEYHLDISVVWSRDDLQVTLSKSILGERRLNLIHEKLDVRAKPICKHFCDGFKYDIEKANGTELIDHGHAFFPVNKCYQSII